MADIPVTPSVSPTFLRLAFLLRAHNACTDMWNKCSSDRLLLLVAGGTLRQFGCVRKEVSALHVRLEDLWYTQALCSVSKERAHKAVRSLPLGFGSSRPDSKVLVLLHRAFR